jgi:phosphoribosylformylglycinamidine cyclo-ligase
MRNLQNDSYKAAGVDVNAGYEAVRLMKADVERTFNAVYGEGNPRNGMGAGALGGFGGLFIPDLSGMKEPVLVSGTDGVGTKLEIAKLLDKHDTVGIDLVAMCANDIICCGAKPLFFLDYISCDRNVPEKIAAIVKGIADGCVQAGCALIGGETAEHPPMTATLDSNPQTSLYNYDLAGFCVGVVDKSKLVGKTAKAGDVLIGLASSGVHSNGFSLIRKVLSIDKAIAQTLLTPTRIYVKPILALIEQVKVKGIAHITGGGFYENIPRCLGEGLTAQINKDFYEVPEIFAKIAQAGNIPEGDMYSTFNMGIGMVVAVSFEEAGKAIEVLAQNGIDSYCIGKIIDGDELKIT